MPILSSTWTLSGSLGDFLGTLRETALTLPSSHPGPMIEFDPGYGKSRVEDRVKEEREYCEHAPWAVNKEWARRIGAASRVT